MDEDNGLVEVMPPATVVEHSRRNPSFWRSVFQDSLKWGVRLAIALGILGVAFLLFSSWVSEQNLKRWQVEQGKVETERAILATPKAWPEIVLPGKSDFKCKVTTRCIVEDYMSSFIDLQLLITGPRMPDLRAAMDRVEKSYSHPFDENAPFAVIFYDRDGFEQEKVFFHLKDFTFVVDKEGALTGMRANYRLKTSRYKAYESYAACSIISRVPEF